MGNSIQRQIRYTAMISKLQKVAVYRELTVNSCKVLPLPNIPQSNKDERSVNVAKQPSAVNLSPKSRDGQKSADQSLKEQTSGDICSANWLPPPIKLTEVNNDVDNKKLDTVEEKKKICNPRPPLGPLPPKPNKNSIQKNDLEVHSPPPPTELANHPPTTQTEDDTKKSRMDSVHKSLCDSASTLPQRSFRETSKGSDFYESQTSPIYSKVTGKGANSYQKSAANFGNSLGETEKGSDFYGPLTASKEEENEEKTRHLEAKKDDSKPEVQSNPVYINESKTVTKPTVPPRKPLNK